MKLGGLKEMRNESVTVSHMRTDDLCIQNDCSDLPRRLIKHIQKSLSWFNHKELEGLEIVWLLDEVPTNTEDKGAKTVMAEGGRIYGSYHAKTKDAPCYIVLFIQDIYRGVRGHLPFYQFTSIPILCISRTLAHEVAHHLIATRGYVFEVGEESNDEEALANRYTETIVEQMRQHWWYKFGYWLMRKLAVLHYSSGIVYSSNQRYCEAAECWYKAWNLDPKLENVSEWYQLAREKCKEGEKEAR